MPQRRGFHDESRSGGCGSWPPPRATLGVWLSWTRVGSSLRNSSACRTPLRWLFEAGATRRLAGTERPCCHGRIPAQRFCTSPAPARSGTPHTRPGRTVRVR